MTTTLDNKAIGTGSPAARTAGAAKVEALVALRDRLAKATGPNWELERDIAVTLFPEYGRLPMPKFPAYTASLDAAVTLEVDGIQEVVVRKYPHGVYVRWTMHVSGEPGRGSVVVYGNDPDSLSPTEAIGRCLARIEYEIAKMAAPVDDAEEQVRVIAGTQSNPNPEGG